MGEKIERWAAVGAVVLALVGATYYLGEVQGGVKADVAGVKADVAAMETRLVAQFADIRAELRDIRRDVADVRERVSALEA